MAGEGFGGGGYPNAFQVVGAEKSFLVVCSTLAERDKWAAELEQCIQSVQKKCRRRMSKPVPSCLAALTGHSLDTHWTLTGHSLDTHWAPPPAPSCLVAPRFV